MADIAVKQRVSSSLGEELNTYLKTFGYNKEDVEQIVFPMANAANEPVGSMGNDTPMAALSEKPQRLFSYFRQLFAQVTNPPIDPIREGLVMALTSYIGSVSKNLLIERPDQCRSIKFSSPVVTNTDLGKIKDFRREEFAHVTLSMTFAVKEGGKGLKAAVDALCKSAEAAVDNRKSTRLNSSHVRISYAVFCLKKKTKQYDELQHP